jgi:hypothetical protein
VAGRKNSFTSPELQAATFRLLAQCLNHYATATPSPKNVRMTSTEPVKGKNLVRLTFSFDDDED